MRVLIDTNVIIDALTGREPWYKDAQQILEMSSLRPGEFFLSANTITDIHYLLKRHIKDRDVVRTGMAMVLELFVVLDVTGEDCINAYSVDNSDFEDAVMMMVAKRTGMEYIITRNVKDFTKSAVRVMEPQEFLELMRM